MIKVISSNQGNDVRIIIIGTFVIIVIYLPTNLLSKISLKVLSYLLLILLKVKDFSPSLQNVENKPSVMFPKDHLGLTRISKVGR